MAFAPGRVNLIGDHTDYTGGLAMALALQLGTEVSYRADPASELIELSSSSEDEVACVPRSIGSDGSEIAALSPRWSRYVGAVVALLRPESGGVGSVVSDLPIGAGLSSSASFELALVLALGYRGDSVSLARLCQRAEHLAFDAPTGILDQLAIASGREGHAMVLDCGSLEVSYVAFPDEAEVMIAHSGVGRTVATTAYSERRQQCAAAEVEIGPLRLASLADVGKISDPLIRRRARHVVSENARVRDFAAALGGGDLQAAGVLMNESHTSLARDFEVSLPALDELVEWLQTVEGVFGARLSGAGFGGCAVALSRPGILQSQLEGRDHWLAQPGSGAHIRYS